jgi:hypothetical protein
MNELDIRRPTNALRELGALVLPDQSEGDSVELAIRTSNANLSARDMAAYLELIDHMYGRLTQEGFHSYARRESGHLEIAEVQHGSLALLVREALDLVGSPERLIVLWLCLKYLPAATHTIVSTYNEYQQGALARENRKRIRREMDPDPALQLLPKARRNQLARLVEILWGKDRALLRRASRFAGWNVIEISIRIRKRDKP